MDHGITILRRVYVFGKQLCSVLLFGVKAEYYLSNTISNYDDDSFNYNFFLYTSRTEIVWLIYIMIRFPVIWLILWIENKSIRDKEIAPLILIFTEIVVWYVEKEVYSYIGLHNKNILSVKDAFMVVVAVAVTFVIFKWKSNINIWELEHKKTVRISGAPNNGKISHICPNCKKILYGDVDFVMSAELNLSENVRDAEQRLQAGICSVSNADRNCEKIIFKSN